MSTKKLKDLGVVTLIYLLAFAVGVVPSFFIKDTILKFFIFDLVATVITFVFSVALRNSSVYDAYWSLTPMVMSIWLFLEFKAFSPWQLLFLCAFNLWSVRLTVNWITVFTDFSYEDWRYRKFRDENNGFMWFIINFFGIHMVPTLVVFAGMLPIFEIAKSELGILSLPGILIILCGVALEFFADRQMHAHLSEQTGKSVCKIGLWSYSRHPNYLGEITVWVGTFLTMLPYALDKWYYGIGAVSVCVLFNVVSIPMMEKRQMSRRPEYKDYREETQRLLILPHKR